MAGCRRLIGFEKPKTIRKSFLTGARIEVLPKEVDRLISLLLPLGIDPKKIEFRLPIKDQHSQAVARIWEKYGLTIDRPIVAICPGAKFSSKRWPVGRYALVADAISDEHDTRIVLVGGAAERDAGDEIIRTCRTSIVNLIGRTDYMECAEVIKRCDLLISNDCGPVHLAAAVGKPVVGIYSSRDYPGSWHPWGDGHTVLRNDSVPCRFCLKTECETRQCINGITVDQVMQTCKSYLV